MPAPPDGRWRIAPHGIHWALLQDPVLAQLIREGVQKARANLGERKFLSCLNTLAGIEKPLTRLQKLNAKITQIHAAKAIESDESDGSGEEAPAPKAKAKAKSKKKAKAKAAP